jgi:hypothetical protein
MHHPLDSYSLIHTLKCCLLQYKVIFVDLCVLHDCYIIIHCNPFFIYCISFMQNYLAYPITLYLISASTPPNSISSVVLVAVYVFMHICVFSVCACICICIFCVRVYTGTPPPSPPRDSSPHSSISGATRSLSHQNSRYARSLQKFLRYVITLKKSITVYKNGYF